MEVLEDAEVVAMNAAWSQNGQAGVEIVYFNIKRGYFRRSYTREKKEESRKWRLSWFSNYPKYKYLQVIIPNILAIAFSANDSFVMYDLNCMSEIVNGKSLLTDW